MYILFSSWCSLHFKCCHELISAPSLLLPLAPPISGSSKKTHDCSAVRASLSHKSNTFLRPLTLLNGVGEWWKPFCIAGRSNVTAYNLSKQDAGIFFFSFTKWRSGWLQSSVPLVTSSSHPTPKAREGQAEKRQILGLTNYFQRLPVGIRGENFTDLRGDQMKVNRQSPHEWRVSKSFAGRVRVRLSKSHSQTPAKSNQRFICAFNYFIRC